MLSEPLPDLLLPYQADVLQAVESEPVTICEKSRRIGISWVVALAAVLKAGRRRDQRGQDVLYMGYERDMTRGFIDDCAMWAKSILDAAVEVGEFLFKDQDEKGIDRDIQAFRIRFASGFEITALCSRPRALRGKQGFVILDEAAFHDDLEGVIKAALALLIWGGSLLVISTHDGVENPFNELVEDTKAGRRPYKHIRITFDDAIAQGLYQRICLTNGIEWSAERQVAWAAQIRAQFPGDSATEELDCIPRNSGGKYLSRVLLEARAQLCPTPALGFDDSFVDRSDESRTAECLEWCEEHLSVVLAGLDTGRRHFLGEDFGRSGDLSVQWVFAVAQDLTRECVLVVELRNVPFREQETILQYICDRLPRFAGAALDARGNGQYLAERARQLYGARKVAEVMLSAGWYAENWPRFKAALEDGRVTIPASDEIVDDFRTVEVVRGVPVVVERTGKGSEKRHGDAAIAALLAFHASENLDDDDADVFGVAKPGDALEAFGGRDFDAQYPGDMYA